MMDHPQVHPLDNMTYKEYLQTNYWKIRRQQAITQALGRCQLCNSDDQPLNVHHRTYQRLGDEQARDLTVLCRSCHEAYHEWKGGR